MNPRDIALAEVTRNTELLKNSIDEPVTRISYDEFKRNALPILANIGDGFDVMGWIGITGHPRVRLEVLDPTTGTVKYNIPPFLVNYKTHKSHGMDSISHAANHFKYIRASSPRQAMVMLARALEEYAPGEEDGKEDTGELLSVLSKIFKDHGIDVKLAAPTEEEKPVEETKSEVGGNSYSDIFMDGEFDEL